MKKVLVLNFSKNINSNLFITEIIKSIIVSNLNSVNHLTTII